MSSNKKEMIYDCGWCDWGYKTDEFKIGFIQTVKHYNYHHSIQGYLYQKLKSI